MRTLPRIGFLLLAASCAGPAAPSSDAPDPGDIDEVVRSACAVAPTAAPASVTLAPGDSARVEARDGCADRGAGFSWSSADTTVAVVAPRETAAGKSAAVVLARGVGDVVVTARSSADPAVRVAIAVMVRSPGAIAATAR